jgi:hypothetical protein
VLKLPSLMSRHLSAVSFSVAQGHRTTGCFLAAPAHPKGEPMNKMLWGVDRRQSGDVAQDGLWAHTNVEGKPLRDLAVR